MDMDPSRVSADLSLDVMVKLTRRAVPRQQSPIARSPSIGLQDLSGFDGHSVSAYERNCVIYCTSATDKIVRCNDHHLPLPFFVVLIGAQLRHWPVL
jgi:hypothetical protein